MTRTIGMNRSGNDLGPVRRSLSARVFALRCWRFSHHRRPPRDRPRRSRTFATPEDAVKALVDAVKAGNLDALLAIFGPEGKELVASSDPATARMNRRVFAVAFREQWHLEDVTPNQKTLVIGNEEWPFPVPLVKGADGWRFDTAAGKEEVLARRIGRNELQRDRDLPRLRHRAAALRATGTRRQARRRARDEVPERSRQRERPVLADRARPEAESTW